MGEGRESHGFHGVKEGGQSSQTEFKRSTVEKWLPMSGGGGGRGEGEVTRVLHSLMGISGKFHCGTTKILQPCPSGGK